MSLRIYFVVFLLLSSPFQQGKRSKGARDCTKGLEALSSSLVGILKRVCYIQTNSFVFLPTPFFHTSRLFFSSHFLSHSLTPFFTKEHKFLLVKPYQDFFHHHKLIEEDQKKSQLRSGLEPISWPVDYFDAYNYNTTQQITYQSCLPPFSNNEKKEIKAARKSLPHSIQYFTIA